MPKHFPLLAHQRATTGSTIANIAIRFMKQGHGNLGGFGSFHSGQQGGFVFDPAHNHVVIGGCAELRACRETGMRDLDRSEIRREIRADKDIQIRYSMSHENYSNNALS